ncbi:MAG TPA: hypothetical protein VMV43_11420 [Candidatus Nanopelagicaceae bacterium]|nr:hypothetical protein [Candidatus Nanopelagicaceae bacterium]
MILEKLKKSPSDLILLIIAAIGIVILLVINMLVFEPLTNSGLFYGILDFEFAWTKDQILIIFTSWGSEGMALQASGVYWDFLYIIGYTVPLFALILLFTRKLSGKVVDIGLYMSLTPFVAGIFDLIENINLLIMLNDYPDFESFVPLTASITAFIKFSFLLVGAIFFLVVLVLTLIKRFKK